LYYNPFKNHKECKFLNSGVYLIDKPPCEQLCTYVPSPVASC